MKIALLFARVRAAWTHFLKTRTSASAVFILFGLIQIVVILISVIQMYRRGALAWAQDQDSNVTYCCEPSSNHSIPYKCANCSVDTPEGCIDIPSGSTFGEISPTINQSAFEKILCTCREDPRFLNESTPNYHCFFLDYHKMPTYATMFIVNGAFYLFYVIEGVIEENNYEIYASFVSGLVVIAFSVQRLFFSSWTHEWDDFVQGVVSTCCLVVCSICTYLMRPKFGWVMFSKVGAKPVIQATYLNLRLFQSALKLDLFFHLLMCVICYFYIVYDAKALWEDFLPGVMTLLALGWELWGWYAMLRESLRWAVIFFVFGFVSPLYFIWSLISTNLESFLKEWQYDRITDPSSVFPHLQYIVCFVGVVAGRIWALALGFRAIRNFDKGLKRVLRGEKKAPQSTAAFAQMEVRRIQRPPVVASPPTAPVKSVAVRPAGAAPTPSPRDPTATAA